MAEGKVGEGTLEVYNPNKGKLGLERDCDEDLRVM